MNWESFDQLSLALKDGLITLEEYTESLVEFSTMEQLKHRSTDNNKKPRSS